MLPTLNDLEQVVLAELIEFESSIARAFRGIAPRQFEQTLNATQFLQILHDLSTFAVELWNTDNGTANSASDRRSGDAQGRPVARDAGHSTSSNATSPSCIATGFFSAGRVLRG
jgi:hypothetical protein